MTPVVGSLIQLVIAVQDGAGEGGAGGLRGSVVLLLVLGWIAAFAAVLIRSGRRRNRADRAQRSGEAERRGGAEDEARDEPVVREP